MKRTKRREVFIEREETVLLRGGTPVRGQRECPVCGPGSLLLTVEEASWLHGQTVRAICRWAESNEVHSLDAPDGRLLVCLGSLARKAARGSGELSIEDGAERKKREDNRRKGS